MNTSSRCVYRFVPFGLSAIYIILIYLILIFPLNIHFLVIMFLYLVPPAGKESMVPAGVVLLRPTYGPYSVHISAVSMAFVDFAVALFMYFNWDLIERIPVLGKWLLKFEEKQRANLSSKKIKKNIAFIFLALFVAFPFQGTGGMGGTVVGRLIGLSAKETLFTILAGSLFGCYLIASIAYVSLESLNVFSKTQNIFFLASILIFIFIFVMFFYFVYRSLRNVVETPKQG